jgi:NAD-dependent SIR2 family protein deacetylase
MQYPIVVSGMFHLHSFFECISSFTFYRKSIRLAIIAFRMKMLCFGIMPNKSHLFFKITYMNMQKCLFITKLIDFLNGRAISTSSRESTWSTRRSSSTCTRHTTSSVQFTHQRVGHLFQILLSVFILFLCSLLVGI